MKRIPSTRPFVVLLLTLGMSACAPTLVDTDGPHRPARSVLVLTGAGMVSSSASDPRYEALWLEAAEKYATGFTDALAATDTRGSLHIIKDRDQTPQNTLVRLVSVEKQDAVLQVTVKHVRTSTENTIYLNAELLMLIYQRYSDSRRSVVPRTGKSKSYRLFSTTGKDLRDTSLAELADQFARELRREGYLR